MIKWAESSYNVAVLDIDTAITHGVKTEIGTAADYKRLRALSAKSGIFRVSAKIDGQPMAGACNANIWANGIDFGCVTNFEGNPTLVSGSLEVTGDKLYVTINVTVVS